MKIKLTDTEIETIRIEVAEKIKETVDLEYMDTISSKVYLKLKDKLQEWLTEYEKFLIKRIRKTVKDDILELLGVDEESEIFKKVKDRYLKSFIKGFRKDAITAISLLLEENKRDVSKAFKKIQEET